MYHLMTFITVENGYCDYLALVPNYSPQIMWLSSYDIYYCRKRILWLFRLGPGVYVVTISVFYCTYDARGNDFLISLSLRRKNALCNIAYPEIGEGRLSRAPDTGERTLEIRSAFQHRLSWPRVTDDIHIHISDQALLCTLRVQIKGENRSMDDLSVTLSVVCVHLNPVPLPRCPRPVGE